MGESIWMLNLVLGKKKITKHILSAGQDQDSSKSNATSVRSGERELHAGKAAETDVLPSMEGTSGPYPESHWGQVASRNWWEASFASVREYADILPEIPKRAGSEPGLCVPSHSWMLTFSDPNMRSQTVISSQQEVRYHRIPHVQGWEVSKRKPRNNEHFQQGATHHSKLTLPHSLSPKSTDIDIKHKPPVYSIWEFCLLLFLFPKWFTVRSPLRQDVKFIGRTPTPVLHAFGT